MAITVTQRGALNTTTNIVASGTSTIASVVLTSGRVYIACVHLATSAGSPPAVVSIAGTGLSMSKRTTTGDSEVLGVKRNELWYGICTASGTVTITMTINAVACTLSDWDIYELDGCKTSGTNGADAIVQAVCDTSGAALLLNMTLAAFADSGNRPFAFCVHGAPEATTHDSGGGYTELLDANHISPDTGVCIQWHSSSADTAPGFSWATSSAPLGIAIEIAIAAAAGGQPVRSIHQYRMRRAA